MIIIMSKLPHPDTGLGLGAKLCDNFADLCTTTCLVYIIIELKGSRLQTDWLDTQIFWSECFLHFKIKTLTTLESYFLQRFLKTFF